MLNAPETRLWPTHFWVGRWRGPHGHMAVLRLTYTCPMEAAGMHSVWVRVSARIYNRAQAVLEEAAVKNIRDQCRAGQTVSPECEE